MKGMELFNGSGNSFFQRIDLQTDKRYLEGIANRILQEKVTLFNERMNLDLLDNTDGLKMLNFLLLTKYSFGLKDWISVT